MCRATVGDLYVPSEPSPRELVQTTVQIEDVGTRQRNEHNHNRSTQIIFVVCLIVCIILLIVGIWIMMEN